jgi:hypothetical protein
MSNIDGKRLAMAIAETLALFVLVCAYVVLVGLVSRLNEQVGRLMIVVTLSVTLLLNTASVIYQSYKRIGKRGEGQQS